MQKKNSVIFNLLNSQPLPRLLKPIYRTGSASANQIPFTTSLGHDVPNTTNKHFEQYLRLDFISTEFYHVLVIKLIQSEASNPGQIGLGITG